MASFPKRGEVFLIDINPETGSEEETPVVVIQNNVGNEFARSIICAIVDLDTNPVYDLEIFLSSKESGLASDGIIRADRIFSLDKSRFARRTGSLSSATLSNLNNGLTISLGLTEF